ncbi:MAG: hypothetical protein IKR05_09460 [Prevotella sp.]|nr:hypothetical protein [Prevotella sp.]
MAGLLIISLVITAIAVVLLSVKVIIKKDGSFTSQHIHDSQAMRDRGIHCVIDQDREQRKQSFAVKEKSRTSNNRR